MKNLFKNKVNLSLFSGILLGIIFIVACNAGGSNATRAASGLSVYNADDELLGTFIGFADLRTTTLQLADGKFLNVEPSSFSNTFIYYTTTDCTETPYISGEIADNIVVSNAANYYLDKDTPVSSTVSNSVMVRNGGVYSCAPAINTDLLGQATVYAPALPSLTFPLQIR